MKEEFDSVLAKDILVAMIHEGLLRNPGALKGNAARQAEIDDKINLACQTYKQIRARLNNEPEEK